MKELVEFLVGQLAEKKEEIEVTEVNNVITVRLAKSDMGKVIGRQGKIIKAIRTVVRAAYQECSVEVVEKDEFPAQE